MLTEQQLERFREDGHVTVPDVFDETTIVASALADIETWSREFLDQMTAEQRGWYLEQSEQAGPALRKLDEPVFHRPIFKQMAQSALLLSIVEQLIGRGVSVFFSQVFCKPPEVGGPKPVHQDNFYFGPDELGATLTVWIALDAATIENGCLFYGDGSHRGPVYSHVAPTDEPYNLQIPPGDIQAFRMTPAPVPAGGISFHHGNTWHQSSSNLSSRPRRAVAMHFLQNDAALVKPALDYDPAVVVKIS